VIAGVFLVVARALPRDCYGVLSSCYVISGVFWSGWFLRFEIARVF